MGLVRAPFGVEGAVKVQPLTDHVDRFEPGSELRLGGERRRVEWSRWRPDHVVVKLSGLDDRTRAELVSGSYLEVEERRPAPEGAWYHEDLIGLEVETESGRAVGPITDVLEKPANDVWVAGTVLIPATRDAVVRVDLAARKVVVADWLLDVEESR